MRLPKRLLFIVAILAGVAPDLFGQPSAISGRVTDGDTAGVPLPGVIVILKNAEGRIIHHTITDGGGNFSLPAPVSGEGHVLHFSAMSYEERTVPLAEVRSDFHVALKPAPIVITVVLPLLSPPRPLVLPMMPVLA